MNSVVKNMTVLSVQVDSAVGVAQISGVALHQSPEAKAKKVEKGKANLVPGWHLTKEQNIEYARLGGNLRAAQTKEKKREWILKVFEGEIDPYHGGYSRFREYLIDLGYKDRRCESCGLTEWKAQPIPLELHHVDEEGGNDLSNLRIICPNCHALTENHGWKAYNKRQKKIRDVGEVG